MSITPTFSGEVQLASWSESHNGGCKVTFWLQSPEDLDAFRALTVRKGNTAGHRFMAALVEISDDEQPVQPESEAPKGGQLAKLAGMLCDQPDFWAFLNWCDANGGQIISSAEDAANFVREVCGVASRAELDHNHYAAERFHMEIRLPYVRWQAGDRR
ncbi:hypothetical protein 8G_00069 [Ralstonia phage Hyacinthe]|uniref:Uncharacterized protein n=3 Tax=Rahariannevirus raharianne TaxID=2846050 RepID=A0A7G5BBA8_9CAUD|nr:hypothetical protein KMC43_gp12 [Ralstonia phage Raharianne]QMV32387.1 hypothetical protein U2_00012 [Ralstonia phage Albius]QMV33501.1 hypothetical protein 8G_00069 [Ralstonia phage Hyacinthe]QMV33581.1 hypothetical protein Y2_00012 [Ralstonia phage Raharianne]